MTKLDPVNAIYLDSELPVMLFGIIYQDQHLQKIQGFRCGKDKKISKVLELIIEKESQNLGTIPEPLYNYLKQNKERLKDPKTKLRSELFEKETEVSINQEIENNRIYYLTNSIQKS